MLETGREGAVRTRNLMREVNQRAVERFQVAGDDEIDLVCECEDVACFETITVTPSGYLELCASGGFLLAPGHLTPAVEDERAVS
jgi:hypothetical protein